MDTTSVFVALGGRSYDILVGHGLIGRAGAEIAARFGAVRTAIVTDATVAALHAATLEGSLSLAGIPSIRIVVPPGEGSKSFAGLEQVVDALLAARLERGDLVVALGGGVVGDLAGFAAAVTRRGMRFVQVPTTLLAQVDSSVGGKTGINTAYGKNLVGAFHQPSLVLADLDVLATLPPREFRAGYAEVVKYGLLGDAAFFEHLDCWWREVFDRGPALAGAIARSCEAKARIVALDEQETSGPRALLNLGHTFGHALEAVTGFDGARLVHGEAVAIGMRLAFAFSARLGLVGEGEVARVAAHLERVGLPTAIGDIPGPRPDLDALMAAIAQDKKVSRGRLTFVLVRGIGRAFLAKDVADADVRTFLAQELARGPSLRGGALAAVSGGSH